MKKMTNDRALVVGADCTLARGSVWDVVGYDHDTETVTVADGTMRASVYFYDVVIFGRDSKLNRSLERLARYVRNADFPKFDDELDTFRYLLWLVDARADDIVSYVYDILVLDAVFNF